MTQKVKEMAPKIWQAIQKSENILMHFHPSPDPDTVGCSLTMLQVLESLGKKATVIKGDSDLPIWVKNLPGSEKIVQKNYLEIDPKHFDLFLIMDSSTPDRVSSLGEIKFSKTMTTVVIDHHISNEGFGDINLVDASYVANCQIIYDLIKEWGIEINPELATLLFLGIYTDSGGFKYPPVSPDTFLAGAELVKINPDYYKALSTYENSNTSGNIKFLGLALNSITTYFNGKVALSSIPLKEIKANHLESRDIERSSVSTMLRSVIGWDISVSLTEPEPDTVSMSFRTRDPGKYDLSKISSVLNGGGHPGAAGAQIKKPFEEAKKYLLEKLAEVYPDLGQP